MGYLQEYAYCHLVESRVQSGGTSSALQFIDQDEEDDPTEGDSRSKPKKKAGVKELETQVAILRMELMLARPKELERSMQSLRRASLRVRDLGYYLEVCEKAMIR